MTITISRIKPCGVTALFGAFLEINIFHSSHTLQRQQLCGFQPHASVDVTTCKHEILETCHSVTFYFIFFSLYSLSNSPISIPIAGLESSLKLPSASIKFIHPPSIVILCKISMFCFCLTSKISRNFYCTPKFTQFVNYFIKTQSNGVCYPQKGSVGYSGYVFLIL